MSQQRKIKEIEEVKVEIIDYTLIFSSFFSLSLFILNFTGYSNSGFELDFITDSIVVTTILLTTIFRRKLNITPKAYFILFAIFFVVFPNVLSFGVISFNKLLIVFIPFYAILTFPLKKTIFIFSLAIIGLGTVAYLDVSKTINISMASMPNNTGWINVISMLVLTGLLVLIVSIKFNQTHENFIGKLIESNEKIAEKERNYREIFNATSDAIVIMSLKGEIIDANEALMEMSGYQKTRILSKGMQIMSSGSAEYSYSKFEGYIEKVLKGEKQVFDWQIKKVRGGVMWVEIALKKTEILGEERLLGFIRDIDEKKRNFLELENYRNELKKLVAERTKKLIHSEKMASIGVLAAGVAHEINNPLNFIQGGINGIQFYFEDYIDKKHTPEIEQMIGGIRDGVKRVSNIVTSLNRYSRRADSYNEKCDLHLIINNCLFILSNQLKDRIEVHKVYTGEIFNLIGNEGKLHHLMINILSNSINTIAENGKIVIETIIVKQNIVVIIKNSGRGLSKNRVQKVEKADIIAKGNTKEFGLDISIATQIIEDHSGTIKFESKKNEMNEVIIELPIKE